MCIGIRELGKHSRRAAFPFTLRIHWHHLNLVQSKLLIYWTQSIIVLLESLPWVKYLLGNFSHATIVPVWPNFPYNQIKTRERDSSVTVSTYSLKLNKAQCKLQRAQLLHTLQLLMQISESSMHRLDSSLWSFVSFWLPFENTELSSFRGLLGIFGLQNWFWEE